MTKFCRVYTSNFPSNFFRYPLLQTISCYCSSAKNDQSSLNADEFRVLKLYSKSTRMTRRDTRGVGPEKKVMEDRALKMPFDQDWKGVWPGPRSFHPASVPLPLRMGLNPLGASPAKKGNAELMKIPNFLHLTPPAIKAHTQAIKKFTSPWPKGLDETKFPIRLVTSDYCHSSPTIRDPLARIVTLQIKLSDLKFDTRSKDKFLRLVGERYDEATDILSIVADRCPTKKQNTDYAFYLLTALYHEAWRFEEWEKEKSEADMEVYVWEGSRCQANALSVHGEAKPQQALLADHEKAVLELFNRGEDEASLEGYKKATVSLLFG